MLGLILVFGLLGQARPVHALPQIKFLGAGGIHTIPSEQQFIVKHSNPFEFKLEDGPKYTAQTKKQRVWQTDNNGFVAHYKEEVDFGQIKAGCGVLYVAIDDDVDERINRWLIDGKLVHTMNQGMVVYGGFKAEKSGHLTLFAEDSIGAKIEVKCPTPTPSPTVTPTPTATPTPTLTPTPTPLPTVTPTPTLTPTVTPMPQVLNKSFAIEKLVRKSGESDWRETVSNVHQGNEVEFSIKATNTGEIEIDELQVIDILPENLELVSDRTNWTIHNLAPSKSFEVTFIAKANEKNIDEGNEKCVTNVANLVFEKHQEASDTAVVCIKNEIVDTGQVLGTITQLPETGLDPQGLGWALVSLLSGGVVWNLSSISLIRRSKL